MKIDWKRWFKIFLILVGIAVPIVSVFGFIVVRDLSRELDQKFHDVKDSIPTLVYSRNFWIRPGNLLSEAELVHRLKERGYENVDGEEQLLKGKYRISPVEEITLQELEVDLQGDFISEEWKLFSFHLKDFDYPPSVANLFFDQDNVGIETERPIHVLWHSGHIIAVYYRRATKYVVLEGIALEPVIVARLNSSDTETRETVPISEIPFTLLQAIVVVEDQRFLEHIGIDPKGILRSIYVNLRAGRYRQGASTITQQMVRNIYLTRAKTLRRKIKEIIMAILIEFRYSKDEILEKYLNEVYFGQLGNLEIHGVAQAAKHYFAKELRELTLAEQALLAALVRGPFYYSPYRHEERAKGRQELVLKVMLENSIITRELYEQAITEELKYANVSTVLDKAPYFTDFIKAQLLREIPDEELMGVGYKIFSTLDTYAQDIAEKAVEGEIENIEKDLKKRLESKGWRRVVKKYKLNAEEMEPLQGVFILLDPKTNQLLSIVGGRSFKDSTYNRALFMRRQIGSIVKPFVFLTGLMYGTNEDNTPLNALSKIEDSPFEYKFDGQTWSPKNYEPDFRGMVTLRYALAHSINIPTAKLALRLGLDRVSETIRAAGIESEFPVRPSLALGAIEIEPIEIARAYSTLANFGYKRDVTAILAITDKEGDPVAQFIPREEQSLPEAEVANVVDMMRSAFIEGTAVSAKRRGFKYPAAGKTGTTNDFRDSWFAGFTNKYLGVGWVGYDRDTPEVEGLRTVLQLTGASGALPIWANVMSKLHTGIPEVALKYPEYALKELEVDIISGGRKTAACEGENIILERFTERNAPQHECPSPIQ